METRLETSLFWLASGGATTRAREWSDLDPTSRDVVTKWLSSQNIEIGDVDSFDIFEATFSKEGPPLTVLKLFGSPAEAFVAHVVLEEKTILGTALTVSN